jgi:hypothetical protein
MRSVWNAELNWGEPLWRYLKTERFIWMVENSCAYFAAATQFLDRFEGAVAVMPPDFPIDPRYGEPSGAEKAFRELKRLTKMNCWHRADYESDAMWKLYAEESKGVAICSTPERMREAFRPFRLAPDYGVEDLWAGDVRYEDLLKLRMKTGMLDRFFAKHKAFSWEREFRLAISVRTAEEFGVNVPELGIQVSVDIATLIERIMLGPALSPEDRDLIISHAQKARLGGRICKSSLLGQPRYV